MSTPTSTQLRQARHLGVKASLQHLPAQRRDNLLAVHQQLDARREHNVTDFVAKALGQKPV